MANRRDEVRAARAKRDDRERQIREADERLARKKKLGEILIDLDQEILSTNAT